MNIFQRGVLPPVQFSELDVQDVTATNAGLVTVDTTADLVAETAEITCTVHDILFIFLRMRMTKDGAVDGNLQTQLVAVAGTAEFSFVGTSSGNQNAPGSVTSATSTGLNVGVGATRVIIQSQMLMIGAAGTVTIRANGLVSAGTADIAAGDCDILVRRWRAS